MSVLHRLKKRFSVGMIITDPRSAERRYNSKSLQGYKHGTALHGASVVCMCDDLISLDIFDNADVFN